MIETTLHQLCRLWEGFWQHAPGKSVVHPLGLWDTTADYRHHQNLLQQLHMQSRQQRNQLWGEVWRQTRLCNVGDALQHDHWLVKEAHNRRSVSGHQIDSLLNAGGLRFCRWSSLGLPYKPTRAGKDDPTQHLHTASWPTDQQKEERSDAAERFQSLTSPSERRRPANNWRVHLLGQNSTAWWRSRKWHQEPSQQGQKHLQNFQQHVEVLSVQHQDQV